jgi:hypothetical protein
LTTDGDMDFEHIFDVSPYLFYNALRGTEQCTLIAIICSTAKINATILSGMALMFLVNVKLFSRIFKDNFN